MRVVEISVERKTFGQTLAELREWIDRKKADPVHFESTTDPSGLIRVRLEFPRAELGIAFRRYWAQTAVHEALMAA